MAKTGRRASGPAPPAARRRMRVALAAWEIGRVASGLGAKVGGLGVVVEVVGGQVVEVGQVIHGGHNPEARAMRATPARAVVEGRRGLRVGANSSRLAVRCQPWQNGQR